MIMPRRALLIVVPLAIFLIAAVYASMRMWSIVGGGIGMTGNGVAALVLGGIGTLALGGGLMALVFFSARHGYDDAADLKARPPEDR
jgi:hypothetical protein